MGINLSKIISRSLPQLLLITVLLLLLLLLLLLIKVKVKQSRYRPGVAQRVPGS
jgi:hypothetical protein